MPGRKGAQGVLPVLDDWGGDSLRSHTGPAARSCNLRMSEKDLAISMRGTFEGHIFCREIFFGDVPLWAVRVGRGWISLIEKVVYLWCVNLLNLQPLGRRPFAGPNI